MAEFILKDSYGKNHTFNKDKIFVQNANGEQIQFTEGTGESVLEPLEVTENGTYNPSAGVDGFNKVTVAVPAPEIVLQNKEVTENGEYTADGGFDGLGRVTVNVDTTKITLLKETTFDFLLNDETGVCMAIISPISFSFDVGKKYFVEWDGEVFECTAEDDGNGNLFITNNTNMFLIGILQDDDTCVIADMNATEPVTHTVKISKNAVQEVNLQDKEVTENGEYTADDGYDGLGSVIVDVPIPEVTLQDKTIKENGTYTADKGFDGLGKVIVDVKGSEEETNGVPFLKMIGSVVTNTNKANVNTVHTLYIPKGAKVICAWANAVYNVNQTYYHYISSVKPVSLDKLTIDTSNANWDTVSYTHIPGIGNYSSYNTLEFRVLVSTDALTVKDAGDGLFAGTVNRSGLEYYFSATDRGVENVMYLKTLDFADGITEVPNYVCYNQIFLDSVDISNMEKIGIYSFSGCESLKSISLNPNLSSLGDSSFSNCKSLTGELVIPNKITTIPSTCFTYTKFDRVVFPPGLTKIGNNAFAGSTHPTEFDFSACTSVPTLVYDTSLGVVGNGQVLKIPSALFDSWSTASKWSAWASQMIAV